jgi:hypothetical protein
MSVYIDHARILYRGMRMNHMLADTSEELLAMADTIGVQRKWVQYPGTWKEHFDVCESKRLLAIAAGAIETDGIDLARLRRAKRQSANRL